MAHSGFGHVPDARRRRRREITDRITSMKTPKMSQTTPLHKSRAARTEAFTLVELLIVIALTGLLLGLLFGPIIQGFKLTNKARSLTQAQDATRFGTETINRELSQAAYVFDNTNTPLAFPIQADPNDPAKTRRNIPFGGAFFNNSGTPLVNYSKIDFIPSATRIDPNAAFDPTTGLPLGGSDVRLPGAPGSRYVRYFIGLRNNVDENNNVQYYENVYEFPRADNDLNPFVLYRAEFDPTDANLVNQTAANQFASGGFNDPYFFYNTNATDTTKGANGKSYAQNWKAIASPVLATTNSDVIAFRRDSIREIVPDSPIQLLTSFAASAVNSDTATPGFLSNTASEAPSAVPSLYTSKFGQWVYPYTVTLFRGSTQNGTGSGKISVTFSLAGGNTLQAQIVDQSGVLGPNAVNLANNFYWMYSRSTGKIFVTMPNATFLIDAQRGRIETALPPLMANAAGVVQYAPDGGGAINVLAPGPNGNYGELIPTVFRKVTRDPNAGSQFTVSPAVPPNDALTVPANQGILYVDLANAAYYPGDAASLNAPLGTGNAGTAGLSPFYVFGGADIPKVSGSFQGIMIVPGSEKVQGPDNTLSNNPANATNAAIAAPAFTYFRVPSVTSSQNKRVDQKVKLADGTDVWQRNSNLTYFLETSLAAYDGTNYVDRILRPALNFTDVPNPDALNKPTGTTITPNDFQDAGLPAKPAGDAGPERDIQVSFMWQNNYARAANGYPLDTNGRQQGTQNTDIKAEPDVVTVSYGTRSLINLNIGTRVYDTSSGQPQTSTVSDKIKVNNVGR